MCNCITFAYVRLLLQGDIMITPCPHSEGAKEAGVTCMWRVPFCPQLAATGGGGQRAFLSDYLRANQTGVRGPRGRLLSLANQAYADLSPGTKEKYKEKGMRGTTAHKAGGHAFGKHPSRVQRPLQAVRALAALADADTAAEQPAFTSATATGLELVACEIQELRKRHRAQAKKDVDTFEAQRSAVQQWMVAEVPRFAEETGLPASELNAGCVVAPCPAINLDFATWTPPASDMARLALSGWTGSVHKSLREAWADLHDIKPPSDLPRLGKQAPDKRSLCWQAGFCLHTRPGRRLHRLVQEFQGLMAKVLQPTKHLTVSREVYNRGAMVLCFLQGELAQSHLRVAPVVAGAS